MAYIDDDDNPYRSPQSEPVPTPGNPIEVQNLPREFFGRRLTVEEYDMWTDKLVRTMVNIIIRESCIQNDPYHDFRLYFPRGQHIYDGWYRRIFGDKELRGAINFLLHSDGSATCINLGDYPHQGYRFVIQPNIIETLEDLLMNLIDNLRLHLMRVLKITASEHPQPSPLSPISISAPSPRQFL